MRIWVFIAALVLTASTARAQAPASVGTVTNFQGSVSVTRDVPARGDVNQPLAAYEPIFQDDILANLQVLALERGDMIDEQHAFEVVHLMLYGPAEQPIRIQLDDLAILV